MKALKVILLALAFIAFQAHAAQRNLAVTKSGAQAQKRVALVIGNAAYKGASPLRNPVNDAKAMSNALNGLGFDVIEVTDATQKEMNRAITAFGSKLNAETAALFFYAGHGMQVRGRNYIIPVDAQIETEAAVPSESVSVDTVLEQLNVSTVSIVILDACRNNPFERSFRKMGGGGLAQMDAPKGSFIAYATAPGKTAADGDGKNGLFTQELLKQINEPGLDLEKVFKRVRASVAAKSGDAQMPWDSSSMTGDFHFKPGTQVASLVPVPAAPAGGGVSLDDLKKQQEGRGQWDKWQQAMKADYDKIAALNAEADLQVTAWERFLASYTHDNPFSAEDETLRAQAQNKKQNAQAQQQQATANLQQQKREAERQRQQAEAAQARQKQEFAPVKPHPAPVQQAARIMSGKEIEGESWESIRNSGNVSLIKKYLELYPKGQYAESALILITTLEDNDAALWKEANKSDSRDDYDAYLAKNPNGKYASLAKVRIKRLQDKVAIETSSGVRGKVVLNAHTGSVIMDQIIHIKNCRVSSSGFTVIVADEYTSASSSIENGGKVLRLPRASTLGDLVKIFNVNGATPKDLMAIMQLMIQLGTLHADLEVI